MKTGEVACSVFEEMRGKQLVGQPYIVWEAFNKAVEKDDVILGMVMEIGFPSEAGRALLKMAAETNYAATYRVK